MMEALGQEVEEAERLADLDDTGLLDVKHDSLLSRYSRIASAFYNVPISLVSLVAVDHQHFPGCSGIGGEIGEKAQTPLSHSFCKHVVEEGKPLIIADAREDERVKENLAIQDLGVISYLGLPLKSFAGNVLGSFCIIDTKPRTWTEEEVSGMRDLANLVIHEIELRRLGRHLKDTIQKLHEEETKTEDLVYMLLHDIRNPLYGMIGGLSFLEESKTLTEDDQEALYICKESSTQMEYLLNQILETHKLKKIDVCVSKEWAETEPFAAPIIAQTAIAAKAKELAFSSDISHAPDKLFIDAGVMERVIQNLLVNAIKYTQAKGKIHLCISQIQNGDSVRIEVSDNGPGLSKDEQEIIFESYQVGKSGKKSQTSIGLGLAFSKAAVKAHGGKIGVDSEPGKGAVFHITLPNIEDFCG